MGDVFFVKNRVKRTYMERGGCIKKIDKNRPKNAKISVELIRIDNIFIKSEPGGGKQGQMPGQAKPKGDL